ncbi:hypothetical protein N2152v2_009630 [Parachlorella kessleri]
MSSVKAQSWGLHHHCPAAASDWVPADQQQALSEAGRLSEGGTNCGFQLNERYLQWDESAQRRLIKIYVAQELKQTVEWVDARLLELSILLPDLLPKLDRLQAKLVLQLVRDTPAVAAKLVHFRELLPELDLSRLLAQYPRLLLDLDADALQRQLVTLRVALPGVKVELLVQREPLLLTADIQRVLEELQRLLPAGQDPIKVLVADPSSVLDMQMAGLPASLEVDDGIKQP